MVACGSCGSEIAVVNAEEEEEEDVLSEVLSEAISEVISDAAVFRLGTEEPALTALTGPLISGLDREDCGDVTSVTSTGVSCVTAVPMSVSVDIYMVFE